MYKTNLPAVAGILLAAVAVSQSSLQAQQMDRFGNRDRATSLFDQPRWSSPGGWLAELPTSTVQWQSGIQGENTTTGVLIQDIRSGSAAEKALLEIGDLIVAVGGYQVGRVANEVHALEAEFNRRADTDGRVGLLVQDHSNGRLAAFQMQLDTGNDFLRGNLVYRNRDSLPADSQVTFQVENLSRPHFRMHIPNNSFSAGEVVNGTFELPYDRQYVASGDLYQVSATVSSGGRTILATAQPARVITQGNPREVELELLPLSRQVVGTGNNRLDQETSRVYREYLGRAPQTAELVAWRMVPDRLDSMPVELMASQEYFDRVGNNARAWIQDVFRRIVGTQPSATELNTWLDHFHRLRNSRTQLLQHLKAAARQR